MNQRILLFNLLLLILSGIGFTQTVVEVTDASINPGDSVVWTPDNVYLLNGFVFVEDSATLTIQPGTVIKGKPGQAENASALIIARGGKIFAEGTPTEPIIFTAEDDDVNDPFDLPFDARGLWGGVILLGRAKINVAGGENNIEGIPVTEERGKYGGDNDDDNSGVMRYVSIRYGGTNIGANNEINGLTFGAIGRGTTIEFIEVFNNADDGFEWFGGTVNTRYLISAFNDDDCFDYDEGWRGKNQFWFGIQASDVGNSAGEHDGGTTPEDGQPFAIPIIYNATYIGSGMTSLNAKNTPALNFRDNAGGKYYNSILTDFFNKAVQIEDLASGEDSRARLEAGDLVIANNIFWNFGAGNSFTDIADQDFVQAHLQANNNRIVDPQLRGISREANGGLDPRLQPGSPALTGAVPPPANDDFFTQTDYLGAFGTDNWAKGWTFLWQAGVLLTTGIVEQREATNRIPDRFYLEQNYPNPFNPATTITYHLPRSSHVTLTIFNHLGQQVAVLVDGMRPAGTHIVTWSPEKLAGGMYFYQLRSTGKVISRKMLYIR